MSLKIFHLIFVTIATLAAAGGAYWSRAAYLDGGQFAYQVCAILSAVLALALLLYGVWFYLKLRRLGGF